MKEKVQAVLNKIRPMLQADGGDVELVDVEDGGGQSTLARRMCRMSHVPDDT